ncbi:MAG: adenylate/guanylate cyclase domain-containing protein, partial [Candidatus Riflebacteria bacterium]|nr:adenylate/guanylate cyclase domain-containing protein [Candidatus Riflebacteria bacterium]
MKIIENIKKIFLGGGQHKTKGFRYNGLLWGAVVSAIAFLMIAGGFFAGLDNYFNAMVFQLGYQTPEVRPQLVVVKKDQATSELLGKNPDRKEFASLFSFLGGSQVVERQQKVRGQKFDLLRVDFGYFPDTKDLGVKTSFDEWSGFIDDSAASAASDISAFNQNTFRSKSRQVRDSFKSATDSSGFNLLLKIESQLWPPKGQNAFKVLAGGSKPLILPTLLVDWTSKDVFAEVFSDRKEVDEESAGSTPENYQSPVELLNRWQNFLIGLGSADFFLKISPFPKKGVALSLAFTMTTPGVPNEYLVEPASIVAFDFVLQGASKSKRDDDALEAAIASSNAQIILAGHTKLEEEHKIDDVSALITRAAGDNSPTNLPESRLEIRTRQILPLERFVKGNARVAMIDVSAGNKSYITEVPLFIVDDREKRLVPAFSLLTAMLALDQNLESGIPEYSQAMETELQRIYPLVVEKKFKGPLQIRDLSIPVNAQGRMVIDFLGSTLRGRFNKPAIDSVSLFECLERKTLEKYYAQFPQHRRLNPELAHNRTTAYGNNKGRKIMMVGPFELSDFDYFPTPLSMETPFTIQRDPIMGVEIHANAVLNILDRRYIKHPDWWQTILALFLSSILLGFCLDILSPVVGAFLTLAFMAGAFWQAYTSYHVARQILNFSSLLFAYPSIWGLSTLTSYLRQRARARSTKEMFSRFVAADVVQYMLDNPELVKPGGEKVELTIFFSDVAGFTSISEALTPEELVILLNEYLGAMTDLLFEYGGTLDKFIGDAVMAFWNFPKKQEDHAVRACLCAIAMQRKINELQIGWAERGLPRVAARAGINTAGVVVGYMGSHKAQMNFTCMGDGVNLASRLEGANKEYGTLLMVSDATYQRAKHVVTGRFLDFLAVKGKKEPVKVFELVCEKGNELAGWFELSEMYDRAIQLHLERKWD